MILSNSIKLNEEGIKVEKKKPAQKGNTVPKELIAALKKNKKARDVFENFSPSNKREYLEWITEAKTEETKYKGLTTAIEWMSEGKGRNWKYEKKK